MAKGKPATAATIGADFANSDPESQENAAPAEAQESDRDKRLRQNLPPPTCPYCSKPGAPVVCKSGRSEPFFTRYYCPNKPRCAYSVKIARPQIDQIMKRHEQEDFSAR